MSDEQIKKKLKIRSAAWPTPLIAKGGSRQHAKPTILQKGRLKLGSKIYDFDDEQWTITGI
jgi:hypothetical protein